MIENQKWINEINDISEATKNYVIEYDNNVYEADNIQDIIEVMFKGYIEVDDPNMQLLFRIDFARALAMQSLANDINVEIVNGNERIKENYAADDDDSDYEKDYEEADVLINIESELTMFSAINRINYARIYLKNNKDYRLIK